MVEKLIFLVLNFAAGIVPTDGGQVYAETDMSRTIVEPWNAVSSLFILLPAVYWGFKLRGRYREYPFITYCLPLLFLGGLGSTLFHAFRSSRFLLLLDVTPTAILTLSLAIYFWVKVLPSWWWVVPLVALTVSLRMWISISENLQGQEAINAAYAVSGTFLFIPTLILLYNTRLEYSYFIFISLACFVLALIFRKTDNMEQSFLPMGTHFLWHILTGVGAFFLAEYLYKLHVKDKNLG